MYSISRSAADLYILGQQKSSDLGASPFTDLPGRPLCFFAVAGLLLLAFPDDLSWLTQVYAMPHGYSKIVP
jgi:hypothetical protein